MRLAILTAAATLALAAPASAAHYPDQVPLDDVRVDAMMGVAANFWQGLDVPPTCDVHVEQAPSLVDVDGIDAVGRAVQRDCTAVLQQGWIARNLAIIGDRRLPVWYRRQSVKSMCALVVHEVGHLRGLDHAESGVMAPRLDQATPPRECMLLGRAFVPRHPHRNPRLER